jgi:hypothetical protein
MPKHISLLSFFLPDRLFLSLSIAIVQERGNRGYHFKVCPLMEIHPCAYVTAKVIWDYQSDVSFVEKMQIEYLLQSNQTDHR